jgi:hypothetical protein
MSSVVEDEAAFLAADPAVQALGIEVRGYARRHPANVAWINLWREAFGDRQDDADLRERTHQLVVSVSWPLTSGGADLAADQASLDALVDALVGRVRASQDHGGLWLATADEADGDGIRVEYGNPVEAVGSGTDQAAFTATIRYAVLERLA